MRIMVDAPRKLAGLRRSDIPAGVYPRVDYWAGRASESFKAPGIVLNFFLERDCKAGNAYASELIGVNPDRKHDTYGHPGLATVSPTVR